MTLPTKPTMGNGRDDYEDRREDRTDRLENRAAKHRAEANARHGKVDSLCRVMNGQPVLVGHHSEKRHRRDLDRMQTNMRKALEHNREADRCESAAANPSTAISGDDPEAVIKLRRKLEGMETEREQIKAHNRVARKGDKGTIALLTRLYRMTPWHDPKRGHPSYVLQNLGANIRRVKQRIEALKAQEGREAREQVVGEWTATENPETNRVELCGPRPQPERKAELKREGWRWSRRATAWQRQATPAAWSSALRILGGWADE